MEEEALARAAWQTLFQVINGSERKFVNTLLDHLNHEHPTLQQGFWRSIAFVAREYSKRTYYDLRNEGSVMWTRAVAAIQDRMPFI